MTERATYVPIANLHALTTVRDPAVLRQNTLDAALDLLALFDGQSISAITETAALVESAGNADRAKKALAMLAIVDSLRK